MKHTVSPTGYAPYIKTHEIEISTESPALPKNCVHISYKVKRLASRGSYYTLEETEEIMLALAMALKERGYDINMTVIPPEQSKEKE